MIRKPSRRARARTSELELQTLRPGAARRTQHGVREDEGIYTVMSEHNGPVSVRTMSGEAAHERALVGQLSGKTPVF